MKIGILGGSFDPIHKGHLNMAMQAKSEYVLDEVWLIPAGHSPNKEEASMGTSEHRVAMCRLAAEDFPALSVNTIEVDSPARSYTYRTMQKLTKLYPDHEFYFIMGGDSLDYFDRWRHPEIICSLCKILVVSRDAFGEKELSEKITALKNLFPADIQIVHCEKVTISSHEIRDAFRSGEGDSIREFLPDNVYEYICRKDLYHTCAPHTYRL